jgi:small-conductance mechanosensitive channel/CRP-like cAMP-binding protein
MDVFNTLWISLLRELQQTHFPGVLSGSLLGLFLLRQIRYPRFRVYLLMLAYMGLFLVLLTASFWLPDWLSALRLLTRLSGYAILASLLTHLLFERMLPRLGQNPPRILQDLFFGGLMLLLSAMLTAIAGYNLSALVPTSAVLTAVLGLALQDTLGNFISGLTLQMDLSVKVGDWVRVDGQEGRVSEIHWRYLALETRNWETVILPNSLLMKNKVIVLGKRQHQPLQWRRWIYFQVGLDRAPSEVIAAVTRMLQREVGYLPQVATTPEPNCIHLSYEPGFSRYAIRYWLTDLTVDDPTDHEIRTRLYFALQRAGLTLALPTQNVYLTSASPENQARWQRELEQRQECLKPLELFASLTSEELTQIAPKLIYAPFGRGEVLTRQGGEGHWLYIIQSGQVSVQFQNDSGQIREVRQLGPGDFFGEMSLLTGAPRTATVIALSDVICYQLDKQTFEAILQQRPALAQYLADVLHRRQQEYRQIQQEMARQSPVEPIPSRENLLEKISRFFGL